MQPIIPQPDPQPEWRSLTLFSGDQAVVNGALVRSQTNCELLIGSGSSVFSGSALQQGPCHDATGQQLYYATLLAQSHGNTVGQERFRLFELLAQLVAVRKSRSAQAECAHYAAAIMANDAPAALESARRLTDAQL